MKPYGVISDTHNHQWSAFASALPDGTNNRLQQILDETWRAAEEVKKAGGDTLIHCGDLFHVRGEVAPSVLNPTQDTYHRIRAELGVNVDMLDGNHDLEEKTADRRTSAITAMERVGVTVIHESSLIDGKLFIPWHEKIADLKADLENWASNLSTVGTNPETIDVFIHAPVNGVIFGIPDHGLDAKYLADLGFRRVFAGHYHNHKELLKDRVYSVGALSHQTWSDVGSKAGFLIVTDNEVKWFKSHAPEFVDIHAEMDPTEVEMLADGNYIRAKIKQAKQSEIEQLRKWLMDSGAAGVVIHAVKDAVVNRTGATVAAGASLEVSLADYIKSKGFSREAELQKYCQEVLALAGA